MPTNKNKFINYLYNSLLIIIPIFLLYNYTRYYKERIINSDEGLPLYGFIEHNTLDLVSFRITQVIYSIPPILFNILGFNLNTIAKIYAISFSLPIFLTMYILYKKNIKYYIIYILSFTFFISYQFYFPIAEYWLGSCFYFILYMLIDNKKTKTLRSILIIILFILIINLHLSLAYPSIILIIYAYLKNKIEMNLLIKIIISFSIYLLLKFTSLTTEYESNIIGVNDFSMDNFNLLNSRILYGFIKSNDWIYVFVVAVFIIIDITKKNYTKQLLLLLFIFISILIINLIFKELPYFFYTLGNLRILLIFLPIIFYEYCPKLLFKPIVIFLIIIGIYKIEKIGLQLEKRYNNIANLVSSTRQNIIYEFDDNVCYVHYKYFYMQTITVNLLENNRNNYFALYNPKLNDIEYLKKDFRKHNQINHKEYKNNYLDYKIKKLEDTKYNIYNFLIDKNITECILE
jgi:hypothetical protein